MCKIGESKLTSRGRRDGTMNRSVLYARSQEKDAFIVGGRDQLCPVLLRGKIGQGLENDY